MTRLKWIACGFFLIAFQGLAQAQWADEHGFVDYGMTHQVIVNGHDVPSSEKLIYNATARILSRMTEGTSYCSGTVVAPEVILTAAHCFMGKPKAAKMRVVVAGEDFAVAGYKMHEAFSYTPIRTVNGVRVSARTENDIALVFLKKKLPSRSVPALLPPQGWTIDGSVDGILAGFGMTAPSEHESLGILRWTEAVVEEMGDPNLMIYGDRNFCQGDSGGPAYMRKDDRYAVIGISSLANCADRGEVVRVSDYVNWIHQQIGRARGGRDI